MVLVCIHVLRLDVERTKLRKLPCGIQIRILVIDTVVSSVQHFRTTHDNISFKNIYVHHLTPVGTFYYLNTVYYNLGKLLDETVHRIIECICVTIATQTDTRVLFTKTRLLHPFVLRSSWFRFEDIGA